MQIDMSRLRFLVADDSPHMRRILRDTLRAFGVRDIREAHDGRSALEHFRRNPPDILIVDWKMPCLDGIGFARQVRLGRSSPNPFVPIILITAYTERDRVLEARDAGVTEILCKPLSPRRLHDRILDIVLKPRPFVRTAAFFGPDRRRSARPPTELNRRRDDACFGEAVRTGMAVT